MLVRVLVYVHVLAAITFFLAHGASAAMVFKVRRETDFARIRALLDLSSSTIGTVFITFLVLLLTGVIMPFLIHIWNRGWVWTSLVLMLFVVVYMGLVNRTHYHHLRRLVGLPYMSGNRQVPAGPPASPDEVAAHLSRISPVPYIIVGYVIPAFVLALMIFKPF